MGLTGSSAANLKMSLDKYCKDKFVTLENIDVDWEGVPFDNKSVVEWIQPRIIDTKALYVRQSSSSNYAENANILFQISIFAKRGYEIVTDRIYRIRDIIAKNFKMGKDINIYDYINTSTSVSIVRVRDLSDQFLGEDINGILQHIIQITMTYTRETQKP